MCSSVIIEMQGQGYHVVGAALALARQDKTNCLFMPFIEKISVPYDMVIFVYDVFGKMITGLEAL